MGVVKGIFIIGLMIALYFAVQYIADPVGFQGPADLIKQENSPAVGFTIQVKDGHLNPRTIGVNKDQKVTLTFNSLDEEYQLAVEELGFLVKLPKMNQSIIRFVADAEGEYVISCLSPCSGDAVGKIIVRK